jgi:hypothetical protein
MIKNIKKIHLLSLFSIGTLICIPFVATSCNFGYIASSDATIAINTYSFDSSTRK